MITLLLWANYGIGILHTYAINVLISLLLSFITIPLDLILLPLEIIAYIISKNINKEEE